MQNAASPEATGIAFLVSRRIGRVGVSSTMETTGPPLEALLWRGRTSQWVNAGYFVLCVLIATAAVLLMPYTQQYSAIGIAVAALMGALRWWKTRSTEYELTTQRLKIRRGILNRRLDEMELYRVKDYVLDEPLLLRVLGLGHITIISSDPSTGAVSLRAVRDAEPIRERLRNAVQAERDRKRVRELDLDELAPPG